MLCEICREPIEPERLEAIPGSEALCRVPGKGGSRAARRRASRITARIAAHSSKSASAAAAASRATNAFCTGEPPCRL